MVHIWCALLVNPCLASLAGLHGMQEVIGSSPIGSITPCCAAAPRLLLTNTV
jgi:hypothetical protein